MLKNRMLLGTKNYLVLCLEDIELYQQGKIKVWFIKGSSYYDDEGWYNYDLEEENSRFGFNRYLDELEDIDSTNFSSTAIRDEVLIKIGSKLYVFEGCKGQLSVFPSLKTNGVFNPTKHITPKTLPLINLQVENFKQTIIEIVDKYAENQEGDLNLKFVLFCNIVVAKYENNFLNLEQAMNLLNPNVLGNEDLVGILPKYSRLQYLNYYSNMDYNSLAKLIKVIYNQWKFRIDCMVFNELDEYLLVFELATERLKLKEISVAAFAIIIDPKTFELYHLLDSKTRDLLINSYILNLKYDADLQVSKGELPEKHWDQIFDWIQETKRFVIDSYE